MLKKRLFAFLLFCLNQVCFANYDIPYICSEHKCKIIIDAGSSGTRLHLYAYDKDQNHDITNVQELLTNKLNPGLAELEIEEIPSYLDNLMQDVPENNFTIDFYATAGMRLLPEYKQYAMYASVRNWFEKRQNWHLQTTRTISGAEEGLFGWIAMNYALNYPSQDLPGFIEVGGASTQVVFPINDFTGVKSDDIITFKLKNRRISLFTHSFLGFGANTIMNKFKDLTVCFPPAYKLNNGELGQGDAALCQQAIMHELNANNAINDIVESTLKANPVSTWYTVGAISTISKKSPLNSNANKFTINELLSKVDATYCKQDWSFQEQNYATSDHYLNQNCLISSFFSGLVTNGYGISQNQTFNTFANDENSNWTIGALQILTDTEHKP